jgi:hypothetical protein
MSTTRRGRVPGAEDPHLTSELGEAADEGAVGDVCDDGRQRSLGAVVEH